MINRYLYFCCCLFFSVLSFTAPAQNFPLNRHEVILNDRIEKDIKGNVNVLPDELQFSGKLVKSSAISANDEMASNGRVKFLAVTVKNNGSKPLLSWQVTEETEVSHYTIERSYNGSFFEEGSKVSFKQASSTYNTYTFLDENLAAEEEEVYYRVRQVDSSGRYMYSQIVSLKLIQSSTIQLVPNPAYDKTSVQVESNKAQAGWLHLVDPSGAVVHKKAITLKKGSNKLILDGLQQFGNGAYYVQVILPGGTLFKKLLLQ